MTRRGLLAHLAKGAFDCNLTVCHLSDLWQEISWLHLCPNNLWVVIDLYLFCEYSTLLVLLLYKLVSDLYNILNSFVLSNNLWFVLPNSIYNCIFSNSLGFFVWETKLSSFIRCFLCRCDGILSCNRVFLKSLDELILFLLQLVIFSFLEYLCKFFIIFVIFIFTNAIPKSFAERFTLIFNCLIFLCSELMTLTSVAYVASPFLYVTIFKFFLVKLIQFSELIGYFWIIGILQCPNQIICCSTLIRSDECNRIAFVACSSCPTDSMHIIF